MEKVAASNPFTEKENYLAVLKKLFRPEELQPIESGGITYEPLLSGLHDALDAFVNGDASALSQICDEYKNHKFSQPTVASRDEVRAGLATLLQDYRYDDETELDRLADQVYAEVHRAVNSFPENWPRIDATSPLYFLVDDSDGYITPEVAATLNFNGAFLSAIDQRTVPKGLGTQPSKLLQGLSISGKDYLDYWTVPGFPQTEGLAALRGYRSRLVGTQIEKIVKHLGIKIGDTVVPPLGTSKNSDALNAYDPRLTSSGSSGGAGVSAAISPNYVAGGSDSAGSLVSPAAAAGAVTYLPSRGASGHILGSDTDPLGLSTVGFISRNFSLMVLLSQVILNSTYSPDGEDSKTVNLLESLHPSEKNTDKIRIGVVKDVQYFSTRTLKSEKRQKAKLQQAAFELARDKAIEILGTHPNYEVVFIDPPELPDWRRPFLRKLIATIWVKRKTLEKVEDRRKSLGNEHEDKGELYSNLVYVIRSGSKKLIESQALRDSLDNDIKEYAEAYRAYLKEHKVVATLDLTLREELFDEPSEVMPSFVINLAKLLNKVGMLDKTDLTPLAKFSTPSQGHQNAAGLAETSVPVVSAENQFGVEVPINISIVSPDDLTALKAGRALYNATAPQMGHPAPALVAAIEACNKLRPNPLES